MNNPSDSSQPSQPFKWVRHQILIHSPLHLLLFFSIVYLFLAGVFAWLYSWTSLQDGNHQEVQGLADRLYFSLITQSTVGYGDIVPIGVGRWLAVTQACLGIFLSALAVGVVTFKLIRGRPSVVFPKVACYDPKNHRFEFRLWNNDQSGLGSVSIATFITETLTLDQDPLIRHRQLRVAVEPCPPLYIGPEGLIAWRTKSNNGEHQQNARTDTSTKDKVAISPLSISGKFDKQVLDIYVSGTSEVAGDAVFAFQRYKLNEIECATYEDAETEFRSDFSKASTDYANKKSCWDRTKFERTIPTSGEYCHGCPFHKTCQLELAKRTRNSSRPGNGTYEPASS